MAYDRYDGRDERGYRDDRQRGHRSGGEREDRGFFDRAIDSVSNFFNDDDSGRRQQQGGYQPQQQQHRGSYQPQAYDQDEGRQRRGREDDRFGHSDRSAFFGGGQSTSFGRGRDEGDYRNQYGRGGGESGGFGRGEYGRQGQDFYSRQGQDYGELGSGRSYPSGYGQTGGGSYRETEHQSFGHDEDRHDRQSGGYQSQGSDRYRPMTGDYGRGSAEQGRQGSGFGSQDFGQQQYGRQERFQDQDGDAGRRYNYGGWGDSDSRQQSGSTGQQSSGFMGGSSSSMRSPQDPHYTSWRQRQIEELDRDYDEYCREHQSRFENEFSGFRQQRQTKRQMLNAIREHFEVVDESGQHVGTVDKVRGDKIILTKSDPEAHGVHRSFTCSLLERVEDNKVYLSGSKDMIRSRLTEEREDDHGRGQQGSSGGGILGGLFGGGSDRDQRQPQATSNQPTGQNNQAASQTGEGPHILDQSFSGTYDDDSSSSSSTRK
jgi:hypothetical protein